MANDVAVEMRPMNEHGADEFDDLDDGSHYTHGNHEPNHNDLNGKILHCFI